MPARKMRIELFDNDGNKYTVSFEGRVTREKALHILDLVELLGGVPDGGDNPRFGTSTNELTKYDKVRIIIQKHLLIGWFSSKEVQSLYEQQIKELISLSTVATYLSRMTDRGVLVKMRASKHLKYRMAQRVPFPPIRRQIP